MMIDYSSLNRKDAEENLRKFLEDCGISLSRLTQRLEPSGGGAPFDMDWSRESLDALWRWASPRLEPRRSWSPPGDGEPARRVERAEMEPDDELPAWLDFHVPPMNILSADTLWLVDGLSRYLAHCVLDRIDGARWVVGRDRQKGYVYQNQPVISGCPVPEWSPMVAVAGMVTMALDDRPASLVTIFDHCTRDQPL